LPRTTAEKRPVDEMEAECLIYRSGHETVLVVEDNVAMRDVVVSQLSDMGYKVLKAANAIDALTILGTDKIDLLFSDVVMPGGMDGYELVKLARDQDPTLRVVLTSGFPETNFSKNTALVGHLHLLSKPYRKTDLAKLLHQVFEENP